MEFRAYPVGYDGHLLAPVLIQGDTDEAAIRQVKGMLNGRPVELWQESRMVGWFEQVDGDIIFLTTEPSSGVGS